MADRNKPNSSPNRLRSSDSDSFRRTDNGHEKGKKDKDVGIIINESEEK